MTQTTFLMEILSALTLLKVRMYIFLHIHLQSANLTCLYQGLLTVSQQSANALVE